MQFIDLGAQQQKLGSSLQEAIARVLDHGKYILGPEVQALETALGDFSGAAHVVSCANGTDALSLALMAQNIGPGDAVFVPAFTFVASGEAPAQLGATPFFVDVDADTFNIDLDSLTQAISEAKQNNYTPKAVIAVDLFGLPADYDGLSKICEAYDLVLIADAAQSFGAAYGTRKVGTLGDYTTTSFFPAKPLGCYGDGGAVFCADEEKANILRSLRFHGKGEFKYDNVRIGLNSRLDTLQAAILLEKLKVFPWELEQRQQVAQRYNDLLQGKVRTPQLPDGLSSAWAQYTLIVDDRARVAADCKEAGIPTAVYYPTPLNKQTGYTGYPVVSTGVKTSEYLADHVISLPMHPYLTVEQQQNVCKAVLTSI